MLIGDDTPMNASIVHPERPAGYAQHAPVAEPLAVDDICWEPAPVTSAVPEGNCTNTADLFVEALIDAQSYRVIAQEALHALARLTAQHRRLTEVHRRLCEEYRALRGAA